MDRVIKLQKIPITVMPADRGKTDRRDCEIKQEQEKKDDISVCMEAVDPGHGGLYRPGMGFGMLLGAKGYGVFGRSP